MQMDVNKLKEDLFRELSLEGLSAEKQQELMGRMLEALLKRIFMETMDKLGEEGMAEYETLLENKTSEEEIARFLEVRIPGYEAFVNNIVNQFKAEMKTSTV